MNSIEIYRKVYAKILAGKTEKSNSNKEGQVSTLDIPHDQIMSRVET
jgi:hypothetical protein